MKYILTGQSAKIESAVESRSKHLSPGCIKVVLFCRLVFNLLGGINDTITYFTSDSYLPSMFLTMKLDFE